MGRETWTKIKEPTESMMEHYESLYLRNQTKWIRRSKLEKEHLGETFKFKGKEYTLRGTLDNKDHLLVSSEDGDFYYVHSDVIDGLILGS